MGGREGTRFRADALDSSRGRGMTGGKGVGYWGADSWSMVWMSVVGKWCWEASAMARSLVSIVLGWALLALRSAWRTQSATVTRWRRARSGFLGIPCRPGGLVGVFAWLKSSLVVELGSIRGNHPHALTSGRWPTAVDGEGRAAPSHSYFDGAPATGGSSTARATPFPVDSGSGGGMTGKESTGSPPHPAHFDGAQHEPPLTLDSGSGGGGEGRWSPIPLILRRGSRHRRIFDSTSGPLTLDSGSGGGMTGKESTFTLVVPPTPLILRRGSRHRRIFDSTSGPTHPGFRLGGRDDGGGVHLHAGRPPHPAHTSTGLPPQADLRQHERAHSPWIPAWGAG